MADDVKQLLQPAVPDEVGTIDSRALVARAVRQRIILRGATAAVAVAAGAVVAGRSPLATPVVGHPSDAPTAAPSGQQLVEVLAFDPGSADVTETVQVLGLRATASGLDAST